MPRPDLTTSGTVMNLAEKPGHPAQVIHEERMLTHEGVLRRASSRLWSHNTAEVPQNATVQAVDVPGRESPQKANIRGPSPALPLPV